MTNIINVIFRSSEFWMAVVAVLGQVVIALGFMDAEVWNKTVAPAIGVYIAARLAGKAAKAAIKTNGGTQ